MTDPTDQERREKAALLAYPHVDTSTPAGRVRERANVDRRAIHIAGARYEATIVAKEPDDTVRALHLVWNGVEWIDDRCGCRYHPDDPNMSHGGAPHVHPCERHAAERTT